MATSLRRTPFGIRVILDLKLSFGRHWNEQAMKIVAIMNLVFNSHGLRAQVFLYSLLFIILANMFTMDDAEILAVL